MTDYVVRTASPPKARNCGDGEWFVTCDEPGCGVYRIGFTEIEANRLIIAHLNTTHKRNLPVPGQVGETGWVDQ